MKGLLSATLVETGTLDCIAAVDEVTRVVDNVYRPDGAFVAGCASTAATVLAS